MPPSCWKIFKYKMSPKTWSRYLRNCGNGRCEAPGHLWQVPMEGDAGTFEGYLWGLLIPSLTWRSWLLSPLSLFRNGLYLTQDTFWAESSSLCSSNSGLDFFTLILVFYQADPLPSQFLPLGVLITKKCKIYLCLTINSPICLLHDFIHH